MSEIYEFAKYVDVLFLFFLIYGLVVNLLATGIVELLSWLRKKWRAHKEKKQADTKQ